MKYSIYNREGFYCQTDSNAIAYRVCSEYLMKIDPLSYGKLKEELDIAYYHNIHSFGVRDYIWAEDGDKYGGKMGN